MESNWKACTKNPIVRLYHKHTTLAGGPNQPFLPILINFNGIKNTNKRPQTPHLSIIDRSSNQNILVKNPIMPIHIRATLSQAIWYIGKPSFKIVFPHHRSSQNQTRRPLPTPNLTYCEKLPNPSKYASRGTHHKVP